MGLRLGLGSQRHHHDGERMAAHGPQLLEMLGGPAYAPAHGEKNGRQGRSAPASVAAARRVSPQTKSGQQGWGLARAKKKKLPESAPPPNEPPAEPRSWRRAPMAPRTRLGKARAAAAAEATCLLLDLSHDEVSIVTHELCDPLQPLLAVHLSTRVAPFDLNSRA